MNSVYQTFPPTIKVVIRTKTGKSIELILAIIDFL